MHWTYLIASQNIAMANGRRFNTSVNPKWSFLFFMSSNVNVANFALLFVFHATDVTTFLSYYSIGYPTFSLLGWTRANER